MVFSEGRFPEKQVCSANTPRSTVRPPSRRVNFVSPALLSLFHLLSEAGVNVCFLSCKRWRFEGPDSFINLPFRLWFHVPHLRVNTPTAIYMFSKTTAYSRSPNFPPMGTHTIFRKQLFPEFVTKYFISNVEKARQTLYRHAKSTYFL